jgi:hypothetical protein
VVTPSNADFAEVVNRAHVALDRQAGKGITRASDIRAIAQNAKEIVLSVKDLRNDFGTGHGRAEVKSIADEMVTLVVGGALLWVRWALTRLEHLILGAPDSLIAELADSRAANPFESVLRAIALDVPGLDLVPQFRIDCNGKWVGRVDLADLRLRLVLEADSYEFHGEPELFEKDCKRYEERSTRCRSGPGRRPAGQPAPFPR